MRPWLSITSVSRPWRPSVKRSACPTLQLPGGNCKRNSRRLILPRCWVRAMISWPGVAALGEADPVQQIEIQHLRDERFAGRRIDLRQAGANVGEPPRIFDALGGGGIRRSRNLLAAAPMHPVTIAS